MQKPEPCRLKHLVPRRSRRAPGASHSDRIVGKSLPHSKVDECRLIELVRELERARGLLVPPGRQVEICARPVQFFALLDVGGVLGARSELGGHEGGIARVGASAFASAGTEHASGLERLGHRLLEEKASLVVAEGSLSKSVSASVV